MLKFLNYNKLSIFRRSRRKVKKTKNRGKTRKSVIWQDAPDIAKQIVYLCDKLDLSWVEVNSLHCMRSENSQTRAYARIWGLSKVWQQALKQKPAYIVEVISEKYDKLSNIEKDKVLLHELTHIPKNFSGSLVPHIRRGKRNFHRKVEDLYSRHIKQE